MEWLVKNKAAIALSRFLYSCRSLSTLMLFKRKAPRMPQFLRAKLVLTLSISLRSMPSDILSGPTPGDSGSELEGKYSLSIRGLVSSAPKSITSTIFVFFWPTGSGLGRCCGESQLLRSPQKLQLFGILPLLELSTTAPLESFFD